MKRDGNTKSSSCLLQPDSFVFSISAAHQRHLVWSHPGPKGALYPNHANNTHSSSAGKLAKLQLQLTRFVPTLFLRASMYHKPRVALVCRVLAQIPTLVRIVTPLVGEADVKRGQDTGILCTQTSVWSFQPCLPYQWIHLPWGFPLASCCVF